MIRYFRPLKVIEAGSGYSTAFACKALAENQAETGKAASHICIEPYPKTGLSNLPVDIIAEPIETTDPDLFESLEGNDILFIDSSHIVRTNGDVVHEYLQILPSLQPGVFVHCHDIFLPREYPIEWIEKNRYFWNEQYLLQALLSDSNKFKPFLTLNHLFHHYRAEIEHCCPILKDERGPEPRSFWITAENSLKK